MSAQIHFLVMALEQEPSLDELAIRKPGRI